MSLFLWLRIIFTLSSTVNTHLFICLFFFSLREYVFWGGGHTPGPTAMKAPSPNHWTAREFPRISF